MIGALVLFVFAFGMTSSSVVARDEETMETHGKDDLLFTTPGSSARNDLCNEVVPACDIESFYKDDFLCRFRTRSVCHITRNCYRFTISNNSAVCLMDPLTSLAADIINSTNLVQIYIELVCSRNDTRLVFNFPNGPLIGNVFSYLHITNCTVYWKDLSNYGQALNVRVLYLENWLDEYHHSDLDYYYRCVVVEESQAYADSRLNATVPQLLSPIVGLSTVGTLYINSPEALPALSPVFTQHEWPNMAEAVFSGTYIRSSDGQGLSRTMPALQMLEVKAEGVYLDEDLDFPWNNWTLFLPFNLSRTLSPNNHYSAPLGIELLVPNVYRRELVLSEFDLPDLRNISFQGFLHQIQLTNCNISLLSNRTFCNMVGLQSLKLSHNNLASLPVDVFAALSELVCLVLDHNILKYLPHGIFQGLRTIQYIDLSDNLLLEISDFTLSNLYSLQTIDLSNNQLHRVSDRALGQEYTDFVDLSSVVVNNNHLSDFPVWLLYLRSLSKIDLSHNAITFQGLKHVLGRLTSDTITYSNRLSGSSLEDTYRPAISKLINLQYNNITGIELAVLTETELDNFMLVIHFFRLNLLNNPLTCDCHMFHFYKYLQKSDATTYDTLSVLPYNFHYIQCHSSSGEGLIPVVDAPVTTFGCIEEVSGRPDPCQCWVRTLDGAVTVYCGSRELPVLPNIIPNEAIHLYFENNHLISIPWPLPSYIHGLETLDLSHNFLDNLDNDLLPLTSAVGQLGLHGNLLKSLPQNVKQMNPNVTLTLRDNPFMCDCNSLWLKDWLITRRHQIQDIELIFCGSGHSKGEVLIDVPDEDFICVVDPTIYIASAGSVAGFLLLIIVAAIPAYKYRGEIKIYLYMHFNWHPFDRTDDTDILGKAFDAFVSYSRGDAHWVCNVLRHRLEPKFQLCLHDRDFMVGAAVAENICSAVNTSRRMILVLSKAFLRSHWCYLEFRQAHYRALKDRSNYLIVVLYEDVSAEDLDKDMRMYLKTNTYLSRDNRWFWEKLHYAMPQRPLREVLRDMSSSSPLVDSLGQSLCSDSASTLSLPPPSYHCPYRDSKSWNYTVVPDGGL